MSRREHPRDPLHGITLETIVQTLVDRHGWKEMGRRIPIRCFLFDPTIKSSLKFLRQTPWARAKVEDWFLTERTPDGLE
ncbi:MAG TPA: VF530 family protein [Verrucomicrobiae bacterium]|nr:VF530 family protein [Verrucomicrobiae bacterium]